jgi:hypothetical protein
MRIIRYVAIKKSLLKEYFEFYNSDRPHQLLNYEAPLDSDTWDRARGWALSNALIVAAEPNSSNEVERNQAWHTLSVLLSEK